MRPALNAAAVRNGGVFLRRDAVRAGYTEREMKTRTGPRGDWVVVRRGCYAERTLWDAEDDEGRYRLRVLAAHLTTTRPAVLSHAAAAVLLDMPTRPRWRELVHVTRPGVTGSRTENGVKHHLAGFDEDDVLDLRGRRVLGLARTAVDIGREHGFEDGVVACDAALRVGLPRRELWRVLDGMHCWPNVTRARAAVQVADGGAQNVAETLLRLMVLELDIGIPETQYEVVEGSRRAFVDLRVGRHLFEFDGRTKYVDRAHGGVADRPASDVLWDEKQREDWLRRARGGHGISRVVWDEMFGPARSRTIRRMAVEYQQTVNRFGREASLPGLLSASGMDGPPAPYRGWSVHNPALQRGRGRQQSGAPESSPAAIPTLRSEGPARCTYSPERDTWSATQETLSGIPHVLVTC